MKRTVLLTISMTMVALCISCGGGHSITCTTSTGTTITTTDSTKCSYPPQRTSVYTYIKNRAFITNYQANAINIVDTDTDELSLTDINVSTNPTLMYSTPNQLTTLVYNSGAASVAAVYNPAEKEGSNLTLGGISDTVVTGANNKSAYVAIRDYLNPSGPAGAVQLLDFTIPEVVYTIAIPQARWLAVSHDGTRLLIMSDTMDDIYYLDPTATVPTPSKLDIPTGTFSHPVAAFFSSDDTKAWILSCGVECGGTTAGLQEVTFATGAVCSVTLQGGRAAVMNGTTLYVVGAPQGPSYPGVAQSVDLTSMTAGNAVTIGTGNHTYVKYLGKKIWVGGTSCGAHGGCLSIWDPTGTTVINNALTDAQLAAGKLSLGDVTGFDIVTSRNVVYVAEGGILNIYDLNGNAVTPLSNGMLPTSKFMTLDVVGKAWDVLMIPNDNNKGY